MKQYRLETTTENGNVIVSNWTMTKEEMKKAIARYKKQDRLGTVDGKTHKTKYRMIEA